MHLTALIIDAPLRFSPAGESGQSVLMLPLGCRLVLDHLVSQLAPLAHGRILVLPVTGCNAGYSRLFRPEALEPTQIVDRQALGRMLARSETSDFLLIVEPRYWPRSGYDFSAVLKRSETYRGASHAIAMGSDSGAIHERVLCDADGQIRRVQRIYRSMTWPQTADAAILCSMLPAQLCPSHLENLKELRASLLATDCFTQDLPVPVDVDDLTTTGGLLAATEHLLNDSKPDTPGFRARPQGVLVAAGAQVHPAARLIPPVIIHPEAEVNEGATVIGPTVLGPRCRVGPGALVARSVIGAEAAIGAGAAVSHKTVVGDWGAREGDASGNGKSVADAENFAGAEPVFGRHTEESAIQRPLQLAIKRMLDLCLSVVGLALLAPLMIAVAVLIKLTSPGPVFFAHSREGRDGREFRCLKFRTMVRDAHRRQRELYDRNEVDGPQFKLTEDPRVTLLGEWLRETNIDELPQLWNVLCGQMSLVGPRPSPFRENQICVPWRRARLAVRPGITGLWQLCRERRGEADFNQWIHYDLLYVRNLSLWLDAKILWYTLVSMGGRRHVPVRKIVGRAHSHAVEHETSLEQPWPI